MSIVTEMRGAVAVVAIKGKSLDASNAGAFKEALKPVLATQKQIVLDLGEVEFVDSSGLGAMLSALRQANTLGGDVKLAKLQRPARVVVELTRMHRVFEIFESVDEAVRSYGG